MALVDLSPAEIAALTIEQIEAISDDTSGLSNAQVNAFSPTQLAHLPFPALLGFTAEHLAALTPTQVAGLSALQLAVIAGAEGVNKVAAIQPAAIAAIPVATFTDFNTLSYGSYDPNFVEKLSATQIASLTTAQFGTISIDAITGQPGHSGYTAAQLPGITPAHIAVLGAEKAAAFSVEQLESFDAEQGEAFREQYSAFLSEEQIAALPTYLDVSLFQTTPLTATYLFSGTTVNGSEDVSATDLVVGLAVGTIRTYLSRTYDSVEAARESFATSGCDIAGIGVVPVEIGLDRESRLKITLKTFATNGQLRIAVPHTITG